MTSNANEPTVSSITNKSTMTVIANEANAGKPTRSKTNKKKVVFSQNLKKKQNSKFSTTWDREVVPPLLSRAKAPQTCCQSHGTGIMITKAELVTALIKAQEDSRQL